MCKYITVSGSVGYKIRVIKSNQHYFFPVQIFVTQLHKWTIKMVSFFIKVILEKIGIPIHKMQRNINI